MIEFETQNEEIKSSLHETQITKSQKINVKNSNASWCKFTVTQDNTFQNRKYNKRKSEVKPKWKR